MTSEDLICNVYFGSVTDVAQFWLEMAKFNTRKLVDRALHYCLNWKITIQRSIKSEISFHKQFNAERKKIYI